MRSSNLLCPWGIIYTSLRDVFLLYYLKCSEKDIKMSTAMNLMKAFLAMNLISKFVSLVNSHFFTLKLVLLCYYKCSSKQCNHVYFVVLCTSKFSGSLKSFILIILIIYLFSFFFFFLRNLLYIFFLFGYYFLFFLFFSFFLRWELLRPTLSNFQIYNTVLSTVVTMGVYTFWFLHPFHPNASSTSVNHQSVLWTCDFWFLF